MALEHALLVSLTERPGSGRDLSNRFERSIGYFWSATHQQVYRVLARMADEGWVSVERVPQPGGPDQKIYAVTPRGARALADWLAEPTPTEAVRSELAVKLRGASYGDRSAVLDTVRSTLRDHQEKLAHYERLQHRDYSDLSTLTGVELDQYLVLRGGILGQRALVDWLTEYLQFHDSTDTSTHHTSDKGER